MQTETRNYVVVRPFHLGEIGVNLTSGEVLLYDGSNMTRQKTGQTYEVNSLALAITARHVVEDDGTVEFKPVTESTTEIKRPDMDVLVQDRDEQVVAKINTPGTRADDVHKEKTTEEVAQLDADTADKLDVVQDQKVVGKANVKKSPRAAAALVEQDSDTRVVTTKSRTHELMELTLAAEGFGTGVESAPIVYDTSDGVVIGKVKSEKERRAEAARRVSVDSQPTDAESVLWPKGFPANAHWQKRIQWVKDNSNRTAAVQQVYAHSTDRFQKQIRKAVPSLSVE